MPYENTGVYSDIPALSEGAARLVAINQNPFLAEMMKRQDARAWEQYQALEAARHVPAFPKVPGASPQAAYQNQMQDALSQALRSGNPMTQKLAQQGFEPWLKAVMGNTEQTQEQKNAFGAAPNDAQMAAELIRRQVDPSFALNVASNNRIKETGYEYGQKRGFEALQFGNKAKLENLDKYGFLAEAPKRIEDIPKTTPSQKTNGKLTKPEMAAQILDTLNTKIDNKTVDDLLKESTGSGIGAAVDQFNRYLGTTTPSAQAASQLETLSGWITSLVPRFEGPQSDYDVQNYKIMAGKLGDRTVPYEEKLKALQVLKSLSKSIAGINDNGATGSWGEAETPVTFKSKQEFMDYAKSKGLSKEEFYKQYPKSFGGQ